LLQGIKLDPDHPSLIKRIAEFYSAVGADPGINPVVKSIIVEETPSILGKHEKIENYLRFILETHPGFAQRIAAAEAILISFPHEKENMFQIFMKFPDIIDLKTCIKAAKTLPRHYGSERSAEFVKFANSRFPFAVYFGATPGVTGEDVEGVVEGYPAPQDKTESNNEDIK